MNFVNDTPMPPGTAIGPSAKRVFPVPTVTERPAPLRWAMMGGAWVLILSGILGPGEIVDVTSDALVAASASGAALHRGGAYGSMIALVGGLIAMAGAWLTIVENTSRHTVHESMTGGPARRRRDR